MPREYIIFGFSVFGFPLNIVSLIVFTIILRQSQTQSNDFYKYYWTKTLVDTLVLLTNIVISLINKICSGCTYNYSWRYFNYWMNLYISFSLSMISIFLDSAAAFNIYRTLSQRFKILDRLPTTLVIATGVVSSFLFYIYKLYERNVIEKIDYLNGNRTIYKIDFGEFRWTTAGSSFRLMNSIIRDGIFVSIIIVLNILILVNMKIIMTNKKKLSNSKNSKRQKVELKMTLMVVISSSITAFVHLITLIHYFIYLNSDFDPIFEMIQMAFFTASFFTSNFIYFFFNNNFYRIIKGFFGK